MSDVTKIEWADSTFNPWEGCTKVGPGCDHCYAENRNARFAGGQSINWGPGAPRRRTSPDNWNKPRQWERNAAAFKAEHGRRHRVFCASLADVFDNEVDPAWRFDLFELIHATPSLDWLLLTKRIGNVGNMLPVPFDFARLYPNVWIGATIVNQAEADRDIPKLLATPAAVRFLSMEPLLGPVDLTVVRAFGLHGFGDFEHGVDWVIVGGESGPGARPMHPDWARSLRDQCRQAAVPMLFKQWGEWQPLIQMTISERRASAGKPLSDDSYVRIDGTTHTTLQDDHEPYEVTDALVRRVGKKAAGRRLDGVEHNGFPESRT